MTGWQGPAPPSAGRVEKSGAGVEQTKRIMVSSGASEPLRASLAPCGTQDPDHIGAGRYWGAELVLSAKRTEPGKPQPKPAEQKAGNNDVGKALRSVYEKTVEEQIPPEMLDLLGKLK